MIYPGVTASIYDMFIHSINYHRVKFLQNLSSSFGVIHVLIQKQNDFIKMLCSIEKIKHAPNYSFYF